MAKVSNVPRFVRMANVFTTTLLRAGFKLVGFGSPMYLLTVKGRKSGLPRTIPIAVVEQQGNRYLVSPYGLVDWVRNLRAAGEAILTRGRSIDDVRAVELPPADAALVIKEFIASGNPIGHFFGVTAESSQEDFERTATAHPVFLLQSAKATISEAA